jgi:hypothetical protein
MGSVVALPFESLIAQVLGWFAGSLAGSALAVYVSGQRWTGWAIALLVLGGTIFYFALASQAVWMMIAGVVAPLLGGFLGQALAKRTSASRAD